MLIDWLCEDMSEVIPAFAAPQDKVKGLLPALKASQTKVEVVKANLELEIASMQAKLQPETPLEVRAQQSALVIEEMKTITT